jgi:hypothetical protein
MHPQARVEKKHRQKKSRAPGVPGRVRHTNSYKQATPHSAAPITNDVVGTLAIVIGRNVGSCLDTAGPRHATYRVTSEPVVYVDDDDGAPLHDVPTTESFQFTVTMHPDGSVEGVTTMEESGHRWQLTASCFFSATGEGSSAIMHYDTGLTIKETSHSARNFEHVHDLEMRANYVAWKTNKLQTMLATSKVCTMMFEHTDEDEPDVFAERAQVTIFKSPFRIDVSRWSRGAHYFPEDCTAARVNFEVASIELVQGVAVAAPVFS